MKLETIIKRSMNKSINTEYHCCDIELREENESFKAYEVAISYRDLLFYCDKGILNYDVNTFGDKTSLMLFNIERD
jgi:hypothetical protein